MFLNFLWSLAYNNFYLRWRGAKNYDDENTVSEIEKYFVCSNDINYLDIENMPVTFMAEQGN